MGGRAHPEFAAAPVNPAGAQGSSPAGTRVVIVLGVILAVLLVGTVLIFAGGSTLDGTAWTLAEAMEYRGADSSPGSAFDVAEHSFTLAFERREFNGRGPVNSYFGGYEASGERITIADVARTEIGGSPEAMQAEETYFTLLTAAVRYERTEQTLTLLDEGGRPILRFERIP